MSSTVGPGRLAAMQGFLRATLPTEVVTMSMYVSPVALSWTMQAAYIIVTVSSANVSGCLISGGPQWEPERVIPQLAGHNPLRPGGSVTFSLGSGDPGDDVETNFSCTACLHSSALWCQALLPLALRLWHLCLNSLRAGGVCLVGITDWAGCNTSVQPGKLLWGTSPFSFSPCCTGGYLAPLLACWWWPSEWLVPHQAPPWGPPLLWMPLQGPALWWKSLQGPALQWAPVGAASSVGTSAGASSLVGSSVGTAWVFTGMVAQVCPCRDLSQSAAHSRMASSEKATYGSISSLNSSKHLAKRHGQHGISGLAFFTQCCRACV